MEYKLYATCPDELTGLLAEEITAIGGTNVKSDYRVVYFDADEELYYRCHLELRLASRICRIIKEIPAGSPNIIFDKTKRIKFHELFPANLPLKINVTSSGVDTKLENHLIGSKIREAITDSFKHFADQTANPSSWDAELTLTAFYHRRKIMLSIDTSQKSLHKRGYRQEGHPAPLKETLAAALLRACGYDGSCALLDPMCGSGTILIEGAMIAMNKAPLIHRKKGEFGFEALKDFNRKLWKKVHDEVRLKQREPKIGLFGSDMNPEFVKLTRDAALAAKVEKYCELEVADFFTRDCPAERGTLIGNIPYGLRLDEDKIDESYLKRIGDTFKHKYKNWTCAVLVPKDSPYKHLGLKPDKKYFFRNGSADVVLLIFTIY